MKDLGIITTGGSASCAYSAGVLLALAERYNVKQPKLVLGCSGSTAVLAYYVAGQYESIRNICVNLLPSKRLVSTRRFYRMIDVDYLIDQIFKKLDPLNAKAVKQSLTDFYLVATDIKTGEPTYLSNRDEIDIFEALRASSAIPFYYNKKVTIGANKYIDGSMSVNLQENIDFVKRKGVARVLVINNTQPLNHPALLILNFYALFLSKPLGRTFKRYASNKKELGEEESVFFLKPSKKLPINALDNNREDIQETMRIGYQDATENQNLKAFLTS